MRYLTKFFKISFLIVMILFGGLKNTSALEDAIVAVVNSEIITLQDLKTYIHSTYINFVTQGLSEDELNQVMLDLEINGINKLIEDKLMLMEANKIGIMVRDKLIEERLVEIKAKYGSEQIFMEALIKNGATLGELKNKILDDFKIKFLIESQVKNRIYVSPKEISQYYEQNKDKYARQERIKLDAIYIPFRDNREEAKKQASEALKALESGEEFAKVVRQYSAPTSFGAVERGQLKPSLEEQLFKLNLGQHSDVIEVNDGFYLFLVTAKTPAKEAAPLEEVKDSVNKVVFKEKFKKRFLDYLEKLKKNAYIEIRQ